MYEDQYGEYILQLFTEVEVASGGCIYRDAKRRCKCPPQS